MAGLIFQRSHGSRGRAPRLCVVDARRRGRWLTTQSGVSPMVSVLVVAVGWGAVIVPGWCAVRPFPVATAAANAWRLSCVCAGCGFSCLP